MWQTLIYRMCKDKHKIQISIMESVHFRSTGARHSNVSASLPRCGVVTRPPNALTEFAVISKLQQPG